MRTTLLLLLAVMAYVTGSVSAGNNWRPVTKTGIVPGGTVPTNAKLAWSAALAPDQMSSIAFNQDATLGFFGDVTGTFYCFEVSNAPYLTRLNLISRKPHIKWTFDADSAITTMAALNDASTIVFFGTQSKIYALDASTGKTAWEAYGVSRFNGVTSDVTVYKGLLFAGTRSGAVVVLNAATGKEISIINSRSTVRGAVALAPSGSGGDFVFTSQDTEIYVGKFTTSPKKAADAGYNVTGLQYNLITTTPALYSDGTTSLAFVTTQGASGGSGGSLLKLDIPTANSTVLYKAKSPVNTAPTVISSDTVVFADSGGNAYCIDVSTSTAKLKWSASFEGSANPAGISDTKSIVYGTYAGIVVALDVATGHTLWTQDLGTPVPVVPALVNSVLIASDSNGNAFALMQAAPIWFDVIVGVLLVCGLVMAFAGYRFFRVTVAVAGCTGIFGIVLVLLTHFTTLSVGAVVGISAGAGVVVAALFTVFYKAAPSLFIVLFAVYTINNVLVAMEIPYTKLGWYIILIEAGAILVVFGMSLGKGLKKGACVLGIAAVSSTLVVDCVLWYPAPILPEYVGIMYAGVFVLSLFIQPCTGKGQRHTTESPDVEQPLLPSSSDGDKSSQV